MSWSVELLTIAGEMKEAIDTTTKNHNQFTDEKIQEWMQRMQTAYLAYPLPYHEIFIRKTLLHYSLATCSTQLFQKQLEALKKPLEEEKENSSFQEIISDLNQWHGVLTCKEKKQYLAGYITHFLTKA